MPKEGHNQRHPHRPQVSRLVHLNFEDNRRFIFKVTNNRLLVILNTLLKNEGKA